MHYIEANKIVVPPERQRREFDEAKLIELRTSIQTKGLMQPIVLKNDGVTLNSGERRLRACKLLIDDLLPIRHDGVELPIGCVPFVCLDDLTPAELYEAELEENVLRIDLTPQERARAIKRLHALRSAQAQAEGRVQTPRSTATELLGKPAIGAQVTAVHDALLVAEYLDDPDVAKAKTMKEAVKIVERKLEREFAQANADMISTDSVIAGHTVRLGSCLDLLPTLLEASFDVAIIDPPYGVGADKWTPQSGSESGQQHAYNDDPEVVDAVVRESLYRALRVMKPSAHLYMFCDIRRYPEWDAFLRSIGWDTWYRPLIWDKCGQGMLMGNADGPRSTYETIIYARRGGKPVTVVAPDVLHYPPTGAKLHAAQKNVDLYVELLNRSCRAGEHVIDWFMGSGTIFPAATQLKLFATGIDESPDCVKKAQDRIKQGEFGDDGDTTQDLDF